ncbi:MAG: hypothetical protein C0393_03995 [Anaerolinea sp.]|nr:hypothetical protein [Anaerolinea sp.]
MDKACGGTCGGWRQDARKRVCVKSGAPGEGKKRGASGSQSRHSSEEIPSTREGVKVRQEDGCAMERTEAITETLLEAKRSGDIRARWAWVEPTVWTERMLTALEEGVKGGKWHSLMDKVYRMGNLEAGYKKVKANNGKPGVDRETVAAYGQNKEQNLKWLAEELASGRYHPMMNLRVEIPKPGSTEKRPLGIPTVKDRVAETALKNVIEPIFEKEFARRSYGFRPGVGCKDALEEVRKLLKEGYRQVVEVDFRKYLETLSYYTPSDETESKRLGSLFTTLIRSPLRLPRHTWTACSSPRFTRCKTV